MKTFFHYGGFLFFEFLKIVLFVILVRFIGSISLPARCFWSEILHCCVDMGDLLSSRPPKQPACFGSAATAHQLTARRAAVNQWVTTSLGSNDPFAGTD